MQTPRQKLNMTTTRKSAPLRFGLLLATGIFVGIAGITAVSRAQATEVSGIVYPLHDLTISTGVGGVVLSKQVALGQSVRATQVLLVLDDRQQTIEVQKRNAIRLDHAQIEVGRKRTAISKELFDQATLVFDGTGAISKDELLHMQADYLAEHARYEQLKIDKDRETAEYRAAELELQLRSVLAPTGGVVTKIHVEPGEWAKPGDALIHLVDSNTCFLKIALTLRDAARIQIGQVASIKFHDGSSVPKQIGRYSFVSPAADPASGLIEARVIFDNSKTKIRPGIKASVEVD